MAALVEIARKSAAEPGFRDALARSNLGYAYAEAAEFDRVIARDRQLFQHLVERLQLT